MRILVINNDGGGFADYIDIAEGTNVKTLFTQQIGSADPSAYLIRVNRQPVPRRSGSPGGRSNQLHSYQDRRSVGCITCPRARGGPRAGRPCLVSCPSRGDPPCPTRPEKRPVPPLQSTNPSCNRAAYLCSSPCPTASGTNAKDWHAVSKRQSNTTGHSPPDAFANRSIKTCPTWTDG